MTLDHEPSKYEICPVCFWEDDPSQGEDVFFETGANNDMSLLEARINFTNFGAWEADAKPLVRQLRSNEQRSVLGHVKVPIYGHPKVSTP